MGLGLLAFGGVAGLVAAGAHDDAKSKCPVYPTACTQAGTDANDRAQLWATVSTLAFIGGGVLAAAGVALILFDTTKSTGSHPSSVRVAIDASGRIAVGTTF